MQNTQQQNDSAPGLPNNGNVPPPVHQQSAFKPFTPSSIINTLSPRMSSQHNGLLSQQSIVNYLSPTNIQTRLLGQPSKKDFNTGSRQQPIQQHEVEKPSNKDSQSYDIRNFIISSIDWGKSEEAPIHLEKRTTTRFSSRNKRSTDVIEESSRIPIEEANRAGYLCADEIFRDAVSDGFYNWLLMERNFLALLAFWPDKNEKKQLEDYFVQLASNIPGRPQISEPGFRKFISRPTERDQNTRHRRLAQIARYYFKNLYEGVDTHKDIPPSKKSLYRQYSSGLQNFFDEYLKKV